MIYEQPSNYEQQMYNRWTTWENCKGIVVIVVISGSKHSVDRENWSFPPFPKIAITPQVTLNVKRH